MAIYSMTGFGKGESVGEIYTLSTEIKTVNNRFKDFKFRMSSILNSLELDLRSTLEKEFKRGSFEISITYKKNEKVITEFFVDPKKVEAYLDLMRPVFDSRNISFNVSPVEFLRADFYREENLSKDSEIENLARDSFTRAVKELKKSRAAEGGKLVGKLLEHLDLYEKHLGEIEKLKTLYPDILREKLSLKLSEKLKDIKIDESRFFQEVIYYLEKLEIEEELTRAKIHLDKLRSVLNSSGEIGRQIDFLLQELGRETNTIGSKSGSAEISSNVVEMKVQLEKIREQALNLE